MGYDPNEPRDAEGKWTDAGDAIRRAASDEKVEYERLLLTKAGRAKAKEKYGIEFLDVKKGQATNIITNERFSIDSESDFDHRFTFESAFIGVSKVDQSKPFAVSYFGDNSGNRYEFATASNKIEDIVHVLKSHDNQEAAVEIYNPKSKKIKAFTIYAEGNEYTNESVGLK